MSYRPPRRLQMFRPLEGRIPAGAAAYSYENTYDQNYDICIDKNATSQGLTPAYPLSPGYTIADMCRNVASGYEVTVTHNYVGSGSNNPIENRDTIKSRAYMRIIDLLCEGEIEGLCDASGNILTNQDDLGKGIFYNGVPLVSDTGQPNYGEFTLGIRYGTQDQLPLPGFGEAADVIQVSQEVRKGTPVTVSINNPATETVEVAIRMPGLLRQRSNGDVVGSTVVLNVLVSLNGGAFVLQEKAIRIKGKASNPFVKSETYVLPQGETPGENTWQVRVERITNNSNSVRLTNDTTLDYIVTQTVNSFSYPLSAIAGIEINAQQFPSVPTRSYHIKGLRIKVPDNYFPGDFRTRVAYDRDPLTGDKVVTGVMTAKTRPQISNFVRFCERTYTWTEIVTGDSNVAGNVKLGLTGTESFQNLASAINAGAGSGTTYAALTTANPKVTATTGHTEATLRVVLSGSTTPVNNAKVTIAGKAYRFRTTLTSPVEGDVWINGSAANAFLNLQRAIGHTGTPNVDYKAAAAHPNVTITSTASGLFVLESNTDGASGNEFGAQSAVPAVRFKQAPDGEELDAAAFTGGTDVLTTAVITPGDKITARLGYASAEVVGIEQVWTGGFYTAWSSNPAWCFYDLLTNRRYGMGDHIDIGQVDKWSLYRIARYCDEEVPDGFGNFERRFGCHTLIQSQEEAWKVIQDFASAFQGMAYWASGAVVCTQDRPWAGPPIAVFTPANTIGGFNYSGTSKTARHTSVTVRWNDPAEFWRSKFEFVSDPDGTRKYGYNPLNVVAFACTSRGQAHRVGKWILHTELNQTDTVNFVTGLEGAALHPGDQITVMDNDRAGVQAGGRILSIAEDRRSIRLDRTVTLGAADNLVTISRAREFIPHTEVETSDDLELIRTAQSEQFEPTNGAGATDTLTFADDLPDAILPLAVWLVETTNLVGQDFRVLNVDESEPGKYAVSALETNDGKFAAVENGIELETPPTTNLPLNFAGVPTPNNLTAELGALVLPSGAKPYIEASWEPAPEESAVEYLVEARRADLDDNWTVVESTSATTSRIEYFAPGEYEIAVSAKDINGRKSMRMVQTIVVPTTNPIEGYRVTGLRLKDDALGVTFAGRDARFEWRLNSPAAQEEIGEEENGADTAPPDPFFQDYIVTIHHATTGALLYTEVTTETEWAFTLERNRETLGGPHRRFTIKVTGRDRWGGLTDPQSLTVENPAPAAPTGIGVRTGWRLIYVEWTNPSIIDGDFVEVWQGTTADPEEAELVATVAWPGRTWAKLDAEPNVEYHFFLRVRDTFGTASLFSDGATGTTGPLPSADIEQFAIDATKLFVGTIILKGDVWSNNTPGAGSIAWNAHQVIYNGALYAIPAGQTADPYVWWKSGETIYRTSTTHPKAVMTPKDFVIATNANSAGLHDLAWRGFANAVIGAAYIQDASIGSAKIIDLVADKIAAGTITGKVIQVAGEDGAIQSTNYVEGEAGWSIRGDGTAELNSLAIREALSLGTGFFNPAFPTRLFSAQPQQVIPFSRAASYINVAGYPVQEFDTSAFPSGIASVMKRGKVFYPGYTTNHGWPIRSAAIFAGLNCDDFDFDPTDGAIGTHAYDIPARPFRLAQDGLNLFTLRVDCKTDTHLGVFFQVHSRPHAPLTTPTQDTTDSMGNYNRTTGSGAGLGNEGRKWTMCAYMREETTATGRQQLTLAARVRIAVAANQWILFGVAPMAPGGNVQNHQIVNGCVTITAENVSSAYESAEIPQDP